MKFGDILEGQVFFRDGVAYRRVAVVGRVNAVRVDGGPGAFFWFDSEVERKGLNYVGKGQGSFVSFGLLGSVCCGSCGDQVEGGWYWLSVLGKVKGNEVGVEIVLCASCAAHLGLVALLDAIEAGHGLKG